MLEVACGRPQRWLQGGDGQGPTRRKVVDLRLSRTAARPLHLTSGPSPSRRWLGELNRRETIDEDSLLRPCWLRACLSEQLQKPTQSPARAGFIGRAASVRTGRSPRTGVTATTAQRSCGPRPIATGAPACASAAERAGERRGAQNSGVACLSGAPRALPRPTALGSSRRPTASPASRLWDWPRPE